MAAVRPGVVLGQYISVQTFSCSSGGLGCEPVYTDFERGAVLNVEKFFAAAAAAAASTP